MGWGALVSAAFCVAFEVFDGVGAPACEEEDGGGDSGEGGEGGGGVGGEMLHGTEAFQLVGISGNSGSIAASA